MIRVRKYAVACSSLLNKCSFAAILKVRIKSTVFKGDL